MLLSQEMESMLNRQYTNEVSSALLYKNIAGYFDDLYFPGFAKFFHKKYTEELEHAERFYKYINQRDGRAKLLGINESELKLTESTDSNNILLPFYDSLKHEQQVSSWINEIADRALEIKDHATYNFILWFCSEQVEEEEEFLQLIAELELIKNDGGDLYKMDRRLGNACDNNINKNIKIDIDGD